MALPINFFQYLFKRYRGQVAPPPPEPPPAPPPEPPPAPPPEPPPAPPPEPPGPPPPEPPGPPPPPPGPNVVLYLERVIPVTCDQEIIIIPNVLSGDPGLSVFRWEQLTGTPINQYITPLTELELGFVQTENRDDKIFRLWVDEGTEFVQVFNVLVTAVPTDYVYHMYQAVLPSYGDALVPDGAATYSHLAPELVGYGTQTVNPALRSVGFQTTVTADVYRNPSRVDLVEDYGDDTFSAPLQSFLNLRGGFHVFDDLDPNKTYRLITRVQRQRLGEITDISEPFSAVAPRHPANPELLIEDELVEMSQQYGRASSEILEVITRSVEVFDAGEDTTESGLNAIHHSQSSILEVINRELMQADAPDDTTVNGLNAVHHTQSAILEVKQLDYSSLG